MRKVTIPPRRSKKEARRGADGRMTIIARGLAAAAAIALALALPHIAPARAQSVADFYRGKSIDLDIGYSVGGG